MFAGYAAGRIGLLPTNVLPGAFPLEPAREKSDPRPAGFRAPGSGLQVLGSGLPAQEGVAHGPDLVSELPVPGSGLRILKFPGSQVPRLPGSQVPGSPGSRVPRFPSSWVPRFPGLRLPSSQAPKFPGPRVPRFPSSWVPRYPGFPDSLIPGFSGSREPDSGSRILAGSLEPGPGTSADPVPDQI